MEDATLLHLAPVLGQYKIVDLFLKKYGVNAGLDGGGTPLDSAAFLG